MENEYSIKFTQDCELYNDFEKLIKYLAGTNYYNVLKNNLKKIKSKKINTRLGRIRIIGEIGNSGIFYNFVPDKIAVSTIKNKNNLEYNMKKKCPLCFTTQAHKLIDPINKVRSLLWRKYLITPNTFPIFKNHFLIMTTDHIPERNRSTQNILHNDKYVLNDMIELYNLFQNKGTLYFNHLIGNSQFHFHFQYTTENIPIKDILYETNELSFEKYETKLKNNIYIMSNTKNKNCLNFLLFYGSISKIGKDMFKFLKIITKQKYIYNILIIPNKNKDDNGKMITAIIIVRKKLKEKNIFDFNLGATGIGGLYVTTKYKKYIDKKLINDLKNYCKSTVVPINKKLIQNLI